MPHRDITLRSDELTLMLSPSEGGRIISLRTTLVDDNSELIFTREARRSLLGPRPGKGPSPLEWGCYPMAPWPGRIAGGRFYADGREQSLPLNLGNAAIHGTVFGQAWTVLAQSESRAVLEVELGPSWPWPGRAIASYEVRGSDVRMELEVEAGPGSSFPAGVGFHPWFSRRGADPVLHLEADGVMATDEGLIPSGEVHPPNDETDFNSPKALGGQSIDSVYCGVRPPITVSWPDLTLEIEMPENKYACLYTPPEAFCIEPMTSAADAFNLESRGFDAGVRRATPEQPVAINTTWRLDVSGR